MATKITITVTRSDDYHQVDNYSASVNTVNEVQALEEFARIHEEMREIEDNLRRRVKRVRNAESDSA